MYFRARLPTSNGPRLADELSDLATRITSEDLEVLRRRLDKAEGNFKRADSIAWTLALASNCAPQDDRAGGDR